ncbi:hypothetical protein IMG5_002320 [Ichthyophthirius multifiliis]|uniref:Uncharacterized protein n=1 Tax=Ichthyophthirius multifiliis TaxID=5932 RepID=G0QJ35_ICHMU|nr:hypothetical protein IMG5_002320 [Ichthyophthirius multifiliis]EGR34759.1 hypothetical protein IMG5_002320 [Ichthyophthirius multifiliis]|eukprot:XP_004040063.1 hypothetical protein IMG5_002320 [Ichthyophthirius multifiliis]
MKYLKTQNRKFKKITLNYYFQSKNQKYKPFRMKNKKGKYQKIIHKEQQQTIYCLKFPKKAFKIYNLQIQRKTKIIPLIFLKIKKTWIRINQCKIKFNFPKKKKLTKKKLSQNHQLKNFQILIQELILVNFKNKKKKLFSSTLVYQK